MTTAAWIQSLAWELTHAMGAAIKFQTQTKPNQTKTQIITQQPRKPKQFYHHFWCLASHSLSPITIHILHLYLITRPSYFSTPHMCHLIDCCLFFLPDLVSHLHPQDQLLIILRNLECISPPLSLAVVLSFWLPRGISYFLISFLIALSSDLCCST